MLSALRQDAESFELVVVDDASTDRTRAIMEAVLAREAPSGVIIRRLYKDKNGGLISAVNDAMAVATGDAFLFLAGDDVSMPDRLARSLRLFAEKPLVQLVYGECQKIDEAGRPYVSSGEPKAPRQSSYAGRLIPRLYAGAAPFGASAAYRRRLFDAFGPMCDGQYGEDNCYWVRALLLGQIYWDPAIYVQWRQHSGNLSNFSVQFADQGWRRRHLEWMEKHATMSAQWLRDIRVAGAAGLVSRWLAFRIQIAALREDRSWALSASSLRCDSWGEWLMRALRLLLVGRISTTIKQALVRLSSRLRERNWRIWAKLKSNSAS